MYDDGALSLSRQPACPDCRPHEWHMLPCDEVGCPCVTPHVPGVTEHD